MIANYAKRILRDVLNGGRGLAIKKTLMPGSPPESTGPFTSTHQATRVKRVVIIGMSSSLQRRCARADEPELHY